MRYRVIPYRAGSRGAAELARGLGGMCLRLTGSRFIARHTDVLINWGNTQGIPCQVPRAVGIPTCTILNDPDDIRAASNKLNFFNLMRESGLENIIPRFWTNQRDIPADAFPIVCRTVLAGHSGEGIVIANTRDELVNAPLYVEYKKKQQEFRVHVGRRNAQSIIIDSQRKARRHEAENPNWQVRNLANGFIYAREGFETPTSVLDAAKQALMATDLDFGAVDVIYNERERRAYVLEINTAPGITGTTVDNYVRFFTGR